MCNAVTYRIGIGWRKRKLIPIQCVTTDPIFKLPNFGGLKIKCATSAGGQSQLFKPSFED